MNLKLNHIQHIGIPITDINVSEAFYWLLGFKNVMSSAFEHNGDKGTVVMMKLNDMIIELYQMPENELKEIRNRQNGHIDHIAFDVDDIDETFSELKKHHLPFLRKSLSFYLFGKTVVNTLT